MTTARVYDVIIAGGGMAGSALAGVLARAGLGVLLIEKERRFRDRNRGESTWPWGVAEASRLGLGEVLERAGRVALPELRVYQDQEVTQTYRWEAEPLIGFSHPAAQEAFFAWAGSLGAATIRPAKVTSVTCNHTMSVRVTHADEEVEYTSRLVVGADGKMSLARRWIGAETISDPEHHRFGGVLLEGVEADRSAVHNAPAPGTGGIWFAQSATATRLYLSLPAERVRATGAGRSLAAFLAVAAGIMPEGALANARRVGPMGFFPNSDVWASRIAGERVVLIGDAAGAADPSLGHGTSLLFRDVRELSELLLAGPNWDTAIAEFARRRREYFAVIRAKDQWYASLTLDEGVEADRRRERHALAKGQDPTLGGFALLEERGPDGLVPAEAARRVYFGECAS